MRHYETIRTVPYPVEAMFDLAADVESYPEFLRGWKAARVIGRADGEERVVEQILGLGPLRWRFTSRTSGKRPTRLHIGSTESPFRRLDIDWRFSPAGQACHLTFEARLELRSPMAESVAGDFIDMSFGDIVSAFEARAQQLYGSSPSGCV